MTNLIILGDIALNGLFVSDKANNYKRFEKVLSNFDDNTFTIANLELPIKAGNELNPDKNIHFYTEENVVSEILPLLKVKLVSLANNHIGDFGLPGVKKTIDVLDNLGIMHSGAGYKPEHIEPVIFEIDNQKVAFFAYVDKNTNPKTENIDGLYINYFDIDDIIEGIRKVKNEVDKIIVSIHWGIDYSYYPTKLQVELSHKMIDGGANIIMGHHTHTLQPFEKYNNGLIFYGLGSFCHGDNNKSQYSSLPMKSKLSAVIALTGFKDFSCFPVKSMKYNYIKIPKFDLLKYSKNKFSMMNMIHRNIVIKKITEFKENVIDPVYSYFFGYYKRPIGTILSISIFNSLFKLIWRTNGRKYN